MKNVENWFYLVKFTSDSYAFKYSPNIVIDVIKAGELVCDAVYLNTFANFKQCYTPYRGKINGKNCQVEYCYLTKLKVQSINDVSLPAISSNKLMGGAIRLGFFCVCDVTHDKILETIFSREELNYDELVLEG